MKTVYLVCATGIATSSMLRVKVQDFLESRGIDIEVFQYRVAEMFPDRITADVIVATTSMPPEVTEKFTVISGLPLLTGIGEEETLEAIANALTDKK
jgi:PTS system galactitol-specific IIB component